MRMNLPDDFEVNERYLQNNSKIADPRLEFDRSEWYNQDGEDLAYFGVEEE